MIKYFNGSWILLSVDEGSAQPDQKLVQIRAICEETLKVAHSMKIVKTQDEANAEESDDD